MVTKQKIPNLPISVTPSTLYRDISTCLYHHLISPRVICQTIGNHQTSLGYTWPLAKNMRLCCMFDTQSLWKFPMIQDQQKARCNVQMRPAIELTRSSEKRLLTHKGILNVGTAMVKMNMWVPNFNWVYPIKEKLCTNYVGQHFGYISCMSLGRIHKHREQQAMLGFMSLPRCFGWNLKRNGTQLY